MSQQKPSGGASSASLQRASLRPVKHSNGCCPHESCIIAALRGARQGLYYGGRIRIAHSIVMQLLFGTGDSVEKLKKAVVLSWQHGKNLGLFVFIYKLIQCGLTNLLGKRRNAYAFIAGIIGASIVWRERTVINQQLFFYLFSRVCEGIITVLRQKKVVPNKGSFGFMSVLIWGIVMYLFERDKNSLQNSLSSSMTFLYHQSDSWERGWRDFVPVELPVATTNSQGQQSISLNPTPSILQRAVTVLNMPTNGSKGGSGSK